ncbi:MAG TPA: AAA domain-containing protein [Ktedonobacteraceae bacterium]|nr:AAA domain-containing protein [Ktedonobacteraceae bacterium]
MAFDGAQQQEQDTPGHACFLCSIDPRHTCHEPLLTGRLVAAQQRLIDGQKTCIVILDTDTARVELHLDPHYYQSLVRELKARGDILSAYQLTLHVYHLPTRPEVSEYKGRPLLRYQTNAYTLAVVEPDILLNITDLNQAEYCARQYTLNRLIPSQATAATIRGNLVHYCFKELLKGQYQLPSTDATGAAADLQHESALDVLQRHLEQALELSQLDLALADVAPDAMRADVMPHLESLAHWYESERTTLWDMPAAYSDQQTSDTEQTADNQVRAETFLLAPEIGLRGRLDLFWQQSGRQRLLELKTGGATGQLPKHAHRWQVYGYHALLAVRRNSRMQKALATLLYSGTPQHAQAFGIPVTIREIQRVNETRNILILSRVTNIPPDPPGPRRCNKCAMLEQCQTVSALLNWRPPEPEQEAAQEEVATATQPQSRTIHTSALLDTVEDRAFFTRYYHLLQIEGHAGEQQQALLWHQPVAERIERGSAISGLALDAPPLVEKDGWSLSFRCINTSELRDGDEILLSSGDPITSEVVSGTIMAISSERVTVWTRELIAHPELIDRYDNDLVHVRTLQNLLRWLHVPLHLRDLVAGKVRPRFIGEESAPRLDFNSEQNLAVARAMQMQDYLLIHGPPGTGKTSVIAEIVKRLTQRGQRVLLAAFTNQAVDNMLKRLDRDGVHDFLRLGHERSVDELVRPRLLQALLASTPEEMAAAGTADTPSYADSARDMLYTMPVVAATTATWSSDRYVPHSSQQNDDPLDSSGLLFDVAIIDEAGQLTVPAILGALRFAKRFILVGDEKQLPPLVLSKEAALAGLAESLFSMLKQWDDQYLQAHPLAMSACVPLRVQYRMNKWIANFSSTVFYDKQLHAHTSIANRYLAYPHPQRQALAEDTAISQALKIHWPLVFLDVHDEAASPDAKSSDAEARAVRDLVAGLLARGIEAQDIGIIAPYRAQVAMIRRQLFTPDPAQGWQPLSPTTPLSVDTVDRFQGGERMVIIMSFATTYQPAEESPRREFLINPNRLNVALTRAQRKLILVGNAAVLETLPTFNRLLTYCRSMHTLIELGERVAL